MRLSPRKLLWLAPFLAGAGAVAALSPAAPPPADPPGQSVATAPKPPTALPVSQVVLFNSGVGYFARSGEVEGAARVELSFPESDINDLLKSLTLQDFGGGRIDAVTYDSKEPAGKTLASFAINLGQNPTLADILIQARGERVELVASPAGGTGPQPFGGTIVSLEHRVTPAVAPDSRPAEVDVLNLLTADGLRAFKLPEVVRVKFANPALEAELKRALEVLARSHDAQKKSVSLSFAGEGKRKVRVGYVVEAPVWKTSYRLVLSEKGAPSLQGWAVVENQSDDDWQNVGMALVSGRPVSFRMDLYNPLYVSRPAVELELFASLRPPTYQGDLSAKDKAMALNQPPRSTNSYGLGVPPFGRPGGVPKPAAVPAPAAPPAGEIADPASLASGFKSRSDAVDGRRAYAKEMGGKLAETLDLSQGVAAAASATQLGDSFQYVIDHPVTVARQKSAMLPIVSKPVEGRRVSIYNQGVQAKHPLLGLRFKNTTGGNLTQGPITVYEGSTYAGDSVVRDLQVNEERLISYAIDLGTEVAPQNQPGSQTVTKVEAREGVVTVTRKVREGLLYKAVNRSTTDRTLLIEHPNRANQQYRLVEPAKPAEETAQFLRFEVPLPAGKSAEFKVAEERTVYERTTVSAFDANAFAYYLGLENASAGLKAKLRQAQELRGKLDTVTRELGAATEALNRITADQDRVRKNLAATPKEAAVYQKYLAKLDAQEKEVDALTERQKQLTAAQFEAQAALAAFVVKLSD